MRILLFNDKRVERDAMFRALPSDTYRVESVADEPSAIAAISRESPQMIIFAAPPKGAPDLARRLAAADSSGQAYMLAVLDTTPPHKTITSLMAAGVHDVIRRPLIDEELLERVKAPGRLMRWTRSVLKPAVFDFSAELDITRLSAWQGLGSLVAEDLQQVVGLQFAVQSGWPEHFGSNVYGATIPMSLAGDELELRVSVVVDESTAKWLCESLLGDPSLDPAVRDDALREFANTAGGAVKRAALCDSVTLTTGLPVNERISAFQGEHCSWTLSADQGRIRFAVVGEIRRRINQRVAASTLSEGMVLAHDLRSEGGLLLAPAGSRLTSSTAAKLARLLGPKVFLEVARVA